MLISVKYRESRTAFKCLAFFFFFNYYYDLSSDSFFFTIAFGLIKILKKGEKEN